jgi:peroxin-5
VAPAHLTSPPRPPAAPQAFLHSGKAHAPFAAPPAAGVALSLPDQLRVRDRGTIMARQLFAEQGPAFADEQVGRLLASLGIDPRQLPAAATPHQDAAAWDRIFAGGAPRLPQPSAAGEHAAGAALAAQAQQAGWAREFERLRLGEAGAGGAADAWTAEYQQQQAQQAQQPGAQAEAWAGEYAGAEAAPQAGWVDEFRSAAAAGSVVRRRAGGDTLEQTRRLADTLAASADPKVKASRFAQFVSKMSRGELIVEDNQVGRRRGGHAALHAGRREGGRSGTGPCRLPPRAD